MVCSRRAPGTPPAVTSDVRAATIGVAGFFSLPSIAVLTGQSTGIPSTRNGEWPMYTADLRGSKYSPLDQINSANFNKLEVAWRFKTDNFGPRPENKLEGTPSSRSTPGRVS